LVVWFSLYFKTDQKFNSLIKKHAEDIDETALSERNLYSNVRVYITALSNISFRMRQSG